MAKTTRSPKKVAAKKSVKKKPKKATAKKIKKSVAKKPVKKNPKKAVAKKIASKKSIGKSKPGQSEPTVKGSTTKTLTAMKQRRRKKGLTTYKRTKPTISNRRIRMAQQKADEASVDQVINDTAGNLGKVRDILFGTQMRDYDDRFVRIDKVMNQELESLREDARRRSESLEQYFKDEFATVIDMVKSEQSARTAAIEDLVAQLKSLNTSLEKSKTEQNQKLSDTKRDLHDQILTQSRDLRDELEEKAQALSTALERETDDLKDKKTDRRMLADMLMELGLRLNDEFELPKNE